MKKFATVLLILCTISGFGQNHLIGMKGGHSWTNVISDHYFGDSDYRNGFTGGFTYEYKFNKKFHIGADLLYAQRGFSNDIVFTDDTGNPIGDKSTIDYNYDYLSLPIKGGFSIGNNFTGFLNLGVVPSLLIKAETITPTFENIDGEISDITDRVTAFDFGAMVEIGSSYKLKEQLLLFTSFAYQQSFTSLANEYYFANDKVKHHGMTLSIGLKYALRIRK